VLYKNQYIMCIRKTLISLSFSVLCLGVAGVSSYAQAQAVMNRPDVEYSYTSERPLMVVRFNQRNVYYERSLYGAVSKAVQVKPAVMFDVVAVSPISRDRDAQQRLEQTTSRAGQRVLESMREIGVPNSRMAYSQTSDPSIAFPEVRLFVR
jgi:hypothetical protein